MILDQYGKEIRASSDGFWGEISPRIAQHIERALYTLGKERPMPWMPILVDHLGRWVPIAGTAGAPKTITFRRYNGIGKTRQL